LQDAQNPTTTTDSGLSTVVGPEVIASEPIDSFVPIIKRMYSEDYPWFNREFEIWPENPLSFSPSGGSPNQSFQLMTILLREQTNNLMRRYAYFRWDTIDVRLTFTAPKNLTGAFTCAIIPYCSNWGLWTDDLVGVTNSQIMLREDSHFVDIGESYDVKMTFPWSFKYPMFNIDWLLDPSGYKPEGDTPNIAAQFLAGDPILCLNKIFLAWVTSVTSYGVAVKGYCKFNGMKFFGPCIADPSGGTEVQFAQSGMFENIAKPLLNQVGNQLMKEATEAGTAYVKSKVCETTGFLCEGDTGGGGEPSNHEEESDYVGFGGQTVATLTSTLGDTLSTSRSPIMPIFGTRRGRPVGAPVRGKDAHHINHFLSRPAPIGYFTATGLSSSSCFLSNNIWANHNQIVDIDGQNFPATTWIRYFKPLARHWRGTVMMHFVICGHAMVECEFTTVLTYNVNTSVPTREGFNSYDTHRTVFSGSKTVTVPMPYLTHDDYSTYGVAAKINDIYDAATTYVSATLTVRATMLDATPVIPCFVFYTIGNDFKLFQPVAPGVSLNPRYTAPSSELEKSVVIANPKKKKDPNIVYSQVQINSIQSGEFQMVDCYNTPDAGLLKPLTTIEDLMSIWSRGSTAWDSPSEDTYYTWRKLAFPVPWSTNTLFKSTFYPDGYDVSIWAKLDYIGYLSSIFLFWKGEIAYKTIVPLTIAEEYGNSYLSVALGTPLSFTDYEESCDDDTYLVAPVVNPGNGCIISDPSINPVLEFSFGYRGTTALGDTRWGTQSKYVNSGTNFLQNLATPSTISSNLFHTEQQIEDFAVLRKIGRGFALFTECLPPPQPIYLYRGLTDPGELPAQAKEMRRKYIPKGVGKAGIRPSSSK